ncbi:MAG: DUF2061 domain-containing protein [Bacteroidetes bacterium]|nr:DUF2061 domain-containing protein [Bacteroidota bacterium]
MKDSNLRSFIKGVSWRIIGTIDTFILSYFIIGSVKVATLTAFTEVATKIILYFLHERIWNVIPWGRQKNKPAHLRSLAKGISWRFFGSIDTIFISFIYSGNPLGSIKLGTSELLTKVALFYIHERVWALINWGRIFEKELIEVNISSQKNSL